MHHTQPPDTTLSDKVWSARPLAGNSSVASVLEADLSLLDSFDCSTITSNSLGDSRFQDSDFTSHYLSNQQYSITAVTTSTGSVAERYAYSAYGQPTFLDASGTPLTTQTSTLNARYLYTGREWDATLGLYHFRARWMSGVAGRFMGRDEVGYDDGDNLYRLNVSLSNLDPEGMAILDADPTSSNGVQWCLHKYDPKRYPNLSIKGDLAMWEYNAECKCVCCSTGFCDGDVKRTPRCRIVVRLSVRINQLLPEKRRKGTYGHEQRHVENFLKSAREAQDFATKQEKAAGCTDEATCEKEANRIADAALLILSDRVFADRSPNCPDPADGRDYDPLHDMPTAPQPECKAPSEVKPFPDYGCLYMPSKK